MRNTGRLVTAVCVTAMSAAVATGCSSDDGKTAASPSPVASSSEVTSHQQSAAESSAAPPALTKPAAANSCDTQFLAGLNERQKLAQLLTVGVTDTRDALNLVQREQVGGIFVGGWTDQGLLEGHQVDQVKAASKIPLMVTIDEEGGRVSRVANVIGAAPSARVTAQTMSPDEAYQHELARGKALKALGVTVNFAPDTDVSSQPDDSVIGDRSFSDDPNVVTQYADAYIRGLHDAGLQTTIKHFPGHGSGSGDSHKGAVTTPPLPQMLVKDLVPFRNLVNSGSAVMVGHLDVPGLTAPGEPASLSPAAYTLLRTGVGYGAAPFNGVIFTDDLSGMKAIADEYGVVQAVEKALEAGADNALWISTDQVSAVLDNLEQAVSTGRLSPQRVDDSVLRNARYKGALTC